MLCLQLTFTDNTLNNIPKQVQAALGVWRKSNLLEHEILSKQKLHNPNKAVGIVASLADVGRGSASWPAVSTHQPPGASKQLMSENWRADAPFSQTCL